MHGCLDAPFEAICAPPRGPADCENATPPPPPQGVNSYAASFITQQGGHACWAGVRKTVFGHPSAPTRGGQTQIPLAMDTDLRSSASPIRNEYHTLPILGEWLDILIFLCYLSIPVQLLLLLLMQPGVMYHRKLTSTFSNIELFRTRLLLLYFAMFIICCGLGHGINAMCSATTDESLWCFLVVPGKMVIALTSGATSAMLLLWMPSLTSWLRAIEIHRKGFTEVVVNELSLSNELSDVTFGSLMHVQDLANQIEQLQIELESLRDRPCKDNYLRGLVVWSLSSLAKLWTPSAHGGGKAASAWGYDRVTPQTIGSCTDVAPGGRCVVDASSSKVPDEEHDACKSDILSISFAGPSWATCGHSSSFLELCGSCGSLQDFSCMLLEGRFLMGQALARCTGPESGESLLPSRLRSCRLEIPAASTERSVL